VHDVRFLRDEDGFWNQLTAADREQALRELRLRVAFSARQSDLCKQARADAEKQLSNLLSAKGRTVSFMP
jgi:predicted Fe-S protein YdhL (DUF1289 family)